MKRFWNVIEASIEAVEPKVVVEVGVEEGATTELLLERLADGDAVVHAVDPVPKLDVERWLADHPERLVFHRERSLSALATVGAADLVLLDGDHNHYTVRSELELLERAARRADSDFPLVLLHDVDWPYGRRDVYYDPEAIPPAERQPHRRAGLIPEQSEPVAEGGLNPHLENAIYENDLRNGVLTAIEDFMEESELDLSLHEVPGFHGLGVLVSAKRLRTKPAKAFVRKLRSASFLREQVRLVEGGRIEAEIRATQQGLRAERNAEAAEQVGALEAERQAMESELTKAAEKASRASDVIGAAEAELAAAREEIERSKQELEEAAADAERAKEEAQRSERAAAEARQEAEAARAALSEHEGLVAELREAREAAETRLADAEEQQGRRLEHAFELRSEEIKAAAAERLKLERQLRKAEADRASAARESSRLKAEVEQVTSERDRERRQLARQEDRQQKSIRTLRTTLRKTAREIRGAEGDVERAAESQSWRLGHGLARLGRRLTFRRPVGEGGLAKAKKRLDGAASAADAALDSTGGRESPDRSASAAYARLERRTGEDYQRRYLHELGLEPSDPDPLESGELEIPLDPAGVLREPGDAGDPSVAVVVCVHDALDDVRECLRSVLAVTERPLHLILVDDGSGPEAAGYLRRFAERHPAVRLIQRDQGPHGYSRAANDGMRASSADWTVLLNSDTIVTPGWLDGIVSCGESSDAIGVVGPLSNAATHQSVPSVRQNGSWAVNPIPDFLTPDGMAFLVRSLSERQLPRFPFINGFCYAIGRRTIDEIGYFDEERFGPGYCEENDFSHRARAAGYELAVADDAYVFHAKSRSYGVDGRDAIFKQSYASFLDKHDRDEIESQVKALESDRSLEDVRARLQRTLDAVPEIGLGELDGTGLRICFLLQGMPTGGSGGVHSVYQEARGLSALGAESFVALPAKAMEKARSTYPDADELFRSYSDEGELGELAESADVLVATHHKTVPTVKRLIEGGSAALPAYYVQDFEPLFAEEGSADALEALASYDAIPGQVLFAKTRWLCDLVGQARGIPVAKVEPSLDRDVFHDRGRAEGGGSLRLTVMLRPRTPRRQPLLALESLRLVHEELGDRVELRTFGCDARDLELLDASGLPIDHRGALTREQVADLLRDSDVFLDASVYQGFGRTGLEAMACGCAPVLPRRGGVHEFARDGESALLADTTTPDGPADAVIRLATEDGLLERLRDGGLAASEAYSVTRAAISELVLLERAQRAWRAARRSPRAAPPPTPSSAPSRAR